MPSAFKGRREDQRLVTGGGRYSDDWNLPGQLHASFRRSDRAHARVRAISTDAAKKLPGVVAVLTGSDIAGAGFRTLQPVVPFPGRGGKKILVPERSLLAQDRVRFVGEEIAVVVAETRAAARDAAELIAVEFEELPPVIGFDVAIAEEATLLHADIPANTCFDFEYGDAARTASLIAQAAHVVRLRLESPRVAPNPMEPRAVLAWYDAGSESFEIRCAHQGGFAMRDALAAIMNVAPEKIRVNLVDVGGAFGARTAPFSEYPVLLHLARQLGRPIKWLSSRSEDFLTDNHGRAVRVEGELAFDSAGRFIALRTEWLCDSGAYLTQAGALTNSINGMTIGAGVYQVEGLYGRHRQLMTNTAPTNAYRGAGRPEAVLIVERLVDQAAAVLDRRSVRDPPPQRSAARADAVSHPDRSHVRQRRFRRAHRQRRGGVALAEFCRAARGGSPARCGARDRLRGVPGAIRRRHVSQGSGRDPLCGQRPDRALQRGGA